MASAILFGMGLACALAGETIVAVVLLGCCGLVAVISNRMEDRNGIH